MAALKLAQGGRLTLATSTVSGNSSRFSGGGISSTHYSSVSVSGSTISGNSTDGIGGGLHNSGNSLRVTNSTITNNSAGSRRRHRQSLLLLPDRRVDDRKQHDQRQYRQPTGEVAFIAPMIPRCSAVLPVPRTVKVPAGLAKCVDDWSSPAQRSTATRPRLAVASGPVMEMLASPTARSAATWRLALAAACIGIPLPILTRSLRPTFFIAPSPLTPRRGRAVGSLLLEVRSPWTIRLSPATIRPLGLEPRPKPAQI